MSETTGDALRLTVLADIDRVRDYRPPYGGTSAVSQFIMSTKACIQRWVAKDSSYWKMADTLDPFPSTKFAKAEQHARGLLDSFRLEVDAGQVAIVEVERTGAMNADLYDLNAKARRLLAYLHEWAVRAGGRPFSIMPDDPDTLAKTGLDRDSYMKAAGWLVTKHLARWFANGGNLTITDSGIDAAENEETLNRALPVSAPTSAPYRVPVPPSTTIAEDVDRLQEELFRRQIEAEQSGARADYFSPRILAESLKWTPERMNRAVKLVRKSLDVDEDMSAELSAPYDEHGIRLTADGMLAAEGSTRRSRLRPDEGSEQTMTDAPDRKKVFVIHGRCEPARKEMGIFLRSLGLEPVWFTDVRTRMGGMTHVIKVVEQGMREAHGIIALITPDEYATLRPKLRNDGEVGELVERWQARPNVLFEAGMAYMRHPDRVVFVLFGEAKLFTDAGGICVLWPTNDTAPHSHRAQLRDLLGGGMQCDINNKHDWMNSGDFDAVTKGLSGVSPLDPFRSSLASSEQPEVGQAEAQSLLTNWLRTRPARSVSMTYAEINAELKLTIPPDMIRALLPIAAQKTGWTVEAHKSTVSLIFRLGGPIVT